MIPVRTRKSECSGTRCRRSLLQSARHVTAAMTLIFALGLALRLAYTLCADDGRFRSERIFAADAEFYHGVGMALAKGHGFTLDGRVTSWRAPAYPLLISVFHRLTARPLFLVRMFQCILGALTPLLIYALSTRFNDRKAGTLAAVGCAISYELVSQTPYILTEVTYTFIFLCWLLALLWYREQPSAARAFSAGLILGVALLVRPALQLIAPVLLPWFFIKGRQGAFQRRGVGHWAVFCVGILTLIVPWIVRNTVAHGTLSTLTSETGKMIYNSHSPGATGGSGGWHRIGVDWTVPEHLYSPNEAIFSRRMAHAGIRHALAHPGATAAQLPRTFWNMWRPWMTETSRLSSLVATVYYIPVMILALTGFLTRRGRRPGVGVLYLVIGYMMALHLALHGIVRHRYALIPLFTLLAAFTLSSVFGRGIRMGHEKRGEAAS